MHYKFFIGLFLCMLSIRCNKTTDPLYERKIIITNVFNQEVTGTFYWSHETFSIPVNGSYTYLESGDGAGTINFGDSDSLIMKFGDGREKTDYNCEDLDVVTQIKDCAKDTTSLFNESKYFTVETSKHKFVSYYNITQADYDEAK